MLGNELCIDRAEMKGNRQALSANPNRWRVQTWIDPNSSQQCPQTSPHAEAKPIAPIPAARLKQVYVVRGLGKLAGRNKTE